jgi:hypothetical protein
MGSTGPTFFAQAASTHQNPADFSAPALEHAVKKWNPVFHKKACDNNKIRA